MWFCFLIVASRIPSSYLVVVRDLTLLSNYVQWLWKVKWFGGQVNAPASKPASDYLRISHWFDVKHRGFQIQLLVRISFEKLAHCMCSRNGGETQKVKGPFANTWPFADDTQQAWILSHDFTTHYFVKITCDRLIMKSFFAILLVVCALMQNVVGFRMNSKAIHLKGGPLAPLRMASAGQVIEIPCHLICYNHFLLYIVGSEDHF